MKRNGECVVARREYVDEDWKMHQNIHIRTVEYILIYILYILITHQNIHIHTLEYILNCMDNSSEYPHSHYRIYP